MSSIVLFELNVTTYTQGFNAENRLVNVSGGMGVIEPENYWNKISRSSHDWAPSTAKAGCGGAGAMVASPNNGSAYDLHANKQPAE